MRAGAAGEVGAANGASYLRHAGGVLPARPVSPAIHSRTRSFFLTDALSACQLKKEGTGRLAAGPCLEA